MSSTTCTTTFTGSALTPPARLLALPAKLRLEIYSHLTIRRHHISISTNTLSQSKPLHRHPDPGIAPCHHTICLSPDQHRSPAVLRPKLQQLARTQPKIIVKVNSSYTYDTRKSMDDSKMVEYIFTAIAGSLYRGGWGSGHYKNASFNVGAHIHRLAHSESSLTSSRDWIVEAVSIFAHRAAYQVLSLRTMGMEKGGLEVLFQAEKCKHLSKDTFGSRMQGVVAWVNDQRIPAEVRLEEGNLEECGWEEEREDLERAIWERSSDRYAGLVGEEEWEETWRETV